MLYEEYLDLTVYKMLERMEARFGEKSLFFYMEKGEIREITYRHFFRDVRKLAAYLLREGLRGTYILVDSRNTYEQIVSMFAASSMGAVPVLVSFNLPEDEIRNVLDRVAPSLIIFDAEDEEIIEDVREQRKEPHMRFLCCTGKGETVREILTSETELYEEQNGADPCGPAIVLMTSGSTSRSKLVVLPHYAMLPHSEVWTERSIFVLPMYHIAGLNILINDMARGTPVCLSSLKNGFRDIGWFRPRDVFAVPSFVNRLIKKSREHTVDISCFQNVSSGGAPQSLDTVAYLNERGIFSMSLYGATETAGMVDYSTPSTYRYGSVGKPGPWNQIRISPEGEILVKGKNVMLGYLGEPEATREALQDGWYHTGDVGYLDQDGFLFITGRIKNIIILSNGENVSPEALEQKLICCGDIDEAIVYGKDDVITTSIWCGNDGGPEKQARIKQYIEEYNKTVPTYYRIRKTVFRNEPFQKTDSGKIRR